MYCTSCIVHEREGGDEFRLADFWLGQLFSGQQQYTYYICMIFETVECGGKKGCTNKLGRYYTFSRKFRLTKLAQLYSFIHM